MRWMRSTCLAILLSIGFVTASAVAADRESGPTPPRLSFLDGDVSFWRPGADDWAPAQRNTPLSPDDALYTGDNGNLELQVGPAAFVRAGSGTDLGLTSVENGLQQYRVTGGHVAVDAQRMPKGEAIELDTPQGAFTIDQPGYYRVDVDDQRTTFVTRRGGRASVVPASGDEQDVAPDSQVTLEGTDNAKLAAGRAPEADEWDRWNLDRGHARPEKPRSAQYVPADVAGADELDEAGDWREEPEYGHVWVPHGVPAGWVPYSTGHWVWDPYYGWTWIDDAPWGWAPFHYGRWVYVNNYWGWAPGPAVVAPAYSPALVAFYSGPGVTVSVGVPFVSWVALSWGEPVIPWWGPVGFSGHCWWGGWGGPRVVNNVVINRNTYVNVRNVNVFRNAQYDRAIVGVREHDFGRGGRGERVHFDRAAAKNFRPVHGRLGVQPTSASLVPREGRGHRPPEQMHSRPVVATRQPQDMSRHYRAAGLNAPAAPPPTRVVNENRARHGGNRADAGARQGHPGAGQPEARPHGNVVERRQPPPVPRAAHEPGRGGRPEQAHGGGRGGQPHPPAVSQPAAENPPAVRQHERAQQPDAPRARHGNRGAEAQNEPRKPHGADVEPPPHGRHGGERNEQAAPAARPAPPPHGGTSRGGNGREQPGGRYEQQAPRGQASGAPRGGGRESAGTGAQPAPGHGGGRHGGGGGPGVGPGGAPEGGGHGAGNPGGGGAGGPSSRREHRGHGRDA